jgi:hypothetical protein
MKTYIGSTLVFLAALVALPLPAMAQHRDRGWHGDIRRFERHDLHQWRSGAWQHGHHDGRLGWWWVVGGMWYFYPQAVYPYPDPYTPPVVVIEQTTPPAVVVQPAPSAPPAVAQQAPQYWYYCESSKTYYPYVPTCAEGWKTVPAKPAGVPQ